MEKWNWGDAPWWWVIAFQGVAGAIVGGVIAGIATWIAVGRPLKKEREHALESELRRATAELQALAIKQSFAVPAGTVGVEQWSPWFADLLAGCAVVAGLARRQAPALFWDVAYFSDHMRDIAQEQARTRDWAGPQTKIIWRTTALSRRLLTWQADPDAYRGWPKDSWERMPTKSPPSAPPRSAVT
ncbi:MAG: hypothetical protein HYU55_20795 [Nocardioides sp.]|nr:hypothetical protein [Nocardioides sp.]